MLLKANTFLWAWGENPYINKNDVKIQKPQI